MSTEERWNPDDDSNVDWSIGVVKGRVEIHYHEPRRRVVMDSENARLIAEGLAKAAYEARYGTKPNEGRSRLGEELRVRMVTRVALVAGSMARDGKSNQEIAASVVDIVMSELA